MDGIMQENSPCEVQDVKSNVFLGTIGAIFGALIGAALWVIIYQSGFIASIAGIAIIFLAYKGYILLSKRKDIRAAVIATIISVVILTIAHFFCWGLDFYNELKIDYEITFLESLLLVPQTVFDSEIIAEDSSIIVAFFKDLIIGFVLIGVGFFTYVRHDLKKPKKQDLDVLQS